MRSRIQEDAIKESIKPYRVLVITPQYAPDYGPSAPIYTALCEDLQHMGCQVTVITGFPHYPGSHERVAFSGKLLTREEQNGVRVIRTYVYTVPKKSLWRRLLYHASFNVSSTLASLGTGKADIVLADAPVLWTGLPLLIKAILPQVPFIYVLHDIYPDVLVQLGVLHSPHLEKLIGRVEGFFYERAARISVLSKGFKDNLLSKRVVGEKISIIPACVDTGFIQPLPRENVLRQRWALEDKFVVLYAGNIGFSQGLETVVRAASYLKEYREICFVFVGDGATKSELLQIAFLEDLTNTRFFPLLPREEVPLLYSMADVGLVSLKRDIVNESVPSKTYTIMASGRPVLATVHPESEVGLLIEQAECGLYVEPENASALAEAVLKLYRNESLRISMGKHGRELVTEHYSRQNAAALYYRLVQETVMKSQSSLRTRKIPMRGAKE